MQVQKRNTYGGVARPGVNLDVNRGPDARVWKWILGLWANLGTMITTAWTLVALVALGDPLQWSSGRPRPRSSQVWV